MKVFESILPVVAFALVVGGCATIITGTQQDILITSHPPSAKVSIKSDYGEEVFNGVTPATARLARQREYAVTVSLEGYQPVTVQIGQTFQGEFLANLLLGGIIGMIVDAATGAMWTLEPEIISVTLSTAAIGSGERRLFATFRALDRSNRLREFRVPLVRDDAR